MKKQLKVDTQYSANSLSFIDDISKVTIKSNNVTKKEYDTNVYITCPKVKNGLY